MPSCLYSNARFSLHESSVSHRKNNHYVHQAPKAFLHLFEGHTHNGKQLCRPQDQMIPGLTPAKYLKGYPLMYSLCLGRDQ